MLNQNRFLDTFIGTHSITSYSYNLISFHSIFPSPTILNYNIYTKHVQN